MSDGAPLAEIEAVYRERYEQFLRVATAIADSREAGRDAVHDAFVSAIRARRRYRGDGTVEAWLWPMLIHSALKRRRSAARQPPRDETPATIWRDHASGDDAEVRAAVAALPERQRLMLFLRYYGDLDYQTIARLTGVQVGTVGAELHAAHGALRRHLKEVPSRD